MIRALRTERALLFFLPAALFGCRGGAHVPSGPCLEAPAAAADGAVGAGGFGRWTAGPLGLPEYTYTLDESVDPRANWNNSEGRPRRAHWHLVGNGRIGALAYNEGYVELYVQERGFELVDRYDPETRNFGGGYSIVVEDPRSGAGRPWSSAYAFKPESAETSRTFGMGYARYSTCYGRIRVDRVITAPADGSPYLVDDVTISNRSDEAATLDHYEVWDVNRHALVPQLLRSGSISAALPKELDDQRRALNDKFTIAVRPEDRGRRVTLRLSDGAALPDAALPGDENLFPPDVFLVALDLDPPVTPEDRFITDGIHLWGTAGSPSAPHDLSAMELPALSGKNQPDVLVAARTLSIPASGAIHLRYAFGTVAQDAPLPSFSSVPADLEAHARLLSERRVRFEAADASMRSAVEREMDWHAYYLRSSGGRQDYFEHAIINQGSAYLFEHGIDGAVRDFVFSAVALSYLDPPLAREILLYASRMRREDSRGFAYATGGFGNLNDAGIHSNASDLELFFGWGLAEYVAATGDVSILDQAEPFWPKSASMPRPIGMHAALGFDHLLGAVGLGPHGLLKVGSGDWDDSITFFAKDRDRALSEGESVANSAMAALVLPWEAALLEPIDAARSAGSAALGADLRTRMGREWTGQWYRRAWFGADEPFGDDVLFSISNAFALIADIPTATQAAALTEAIDRHLVQPSSTAPVQFWYAKPPSSTTQGITDEGATNAALTALLVWGYAHAAPDRAGDLLIRSTMARKADAYPDIWYGIWSGPDSYYTNASARPGETWISPATPMTDFPIMNSNAHAGPLLGALRIMGLEPGVEVESGHPVLYLSIAPRLAETKIDTPLVLIEAHDGRYFGEYRPVTDAEIRLRFGAPPGRKIIGHLVIDGAEVLEARAAVSKTIKRTAKKGAPFAFSVEGPG